MGKTFSKYDTWSKYIITPFETLNVFTVKKPIKKRKFYNGNIKVDYYQYFGPKPTNT